MGNGKVVVRWNSSEICRDNDRRSLLGRRMNWMPGSRDADEKLYPAGAAHSFLELMRPSSFRTRASFWLKSLHALMVSKFGCPCQTWASFRPVSTALAASSKRQGLEAWPS